MFKDPFLKHVASHVKANGGWSRASMKPKAHTKSPAPDKKVFVIEREGRRFAVVATDFVAADNRLSTLL